MLIFFFFFENVRYGRLECVGDSREVYDGLGGGCIVSISGTFSLYLKAAG